MAPPINSNDATFVAIVHIADAFRWWAVPGAFLASVLIAPLIWRLARWQLASWLMPRCRAAARIITPVGHPSDTVMDDKPRFGAFFGALILMQAVMIGGTMIPLSRMDAANSFMVLTLNVFGLHWLEAAVGWRFVLALVWMLWGIGCWFVAMAFSPRPKLLALASVFIWFAAFVATNELKVVL